jgi:hypothetical protein
MHSMRKHDEQVTMQIWTNINIGDPIIVKPES